MNGLQIIVYLNISLNIPNLNNARGIYAPVSFNRFVTVGCLMFHLL